MLRKAILPLVALFLIVGCGSSYPPDDVAKDIFLQIAEKNTMFFKANADKSEVKLIKLQPINKYKQNIDGEEWSVIEYEFSYDHHGLPNPNTWINSCYDRFTVAFIQRGNSWYGRLISIGTVTNTEK